MKGFSLVLAIIGLNKANTGQDDDDDYCHDQLVYNKLTCCSSLLIMA
jgi:hypothetical protein